MNSRAWLKLVSLTCGAVLAAACVVTTSDDDDKNPDDLNDGGRTNTNTGGKTSVDDDSNEGGTAGTGGTTETPQGGSSGETGTCEFDMDTTCAACLDDADNGFTTSDGDGVWDQCDSFPCCDESARYVMCMRTYLEDLDQVPEDYNDDVESYCADFVLIGMDREEEDLSEEFYSLAADAFSSSGDPSCYDICFYPEEN